MRVLLVCLSVVGFCVSAGLGDGPTLQKSADGKKIVPLEMARLNADGTITDRIPFGGQQRGYEYCLVFDCFEPGPDGPTGFDTCGMEDGSNNESGGSRWYSDACNSYVSNDMEFDPAYGGRYVERMMWAWGWHVNGPGTGENMALVFETFEDFDETCQTGDPNGQGEWLGGVVFYYGHTNSEPNYYLWSDSEDMLWGLDWVQLPLDGAGSYNFWIMSYDDADPNTLYLATCAGPMLWGTGTNEWPNIDCIGRGQGPCPDGGFPPDGTTSHQGIIQWDDDDPADAWHTAPDECYVYTYGVCPDPLGAMWCAYVGDDWPWDPDGDGDWDQADLGVVLAAWCSHEGDPNWNERADLDGDGHVGHGDLGILLSNWGC
ncbi:MAG TPA: hypothetical protein VM487_11255 [Phycisphaerae bacterium]|nr:hypothetical protein [Phycisphaerae bacterium]